MKTILQSISTLGLLLATLLPVSAQVSSTTTLPGYYTLGLNAGWSYQSSDIRPTDEGFGVGLTLGKNLFYRPGAPVSLDLRGRLLYARQYGLDPFRTYSISDNDALNGDGALNYLNYPSELNEQQGFVFQNHRTDLAEIGLEGVITLNSLKEETGLLVSAYGGIGLDWYLTRLDQANANGQEYYTDYSRFDASRPTGQITKDLRQNILDGTYETNAETFGDYGKLGFMPSVGLEIGYQFSPNFALTAGHRVTFSGTDLLDGHQWEDLDNDLYHYTTLGMQFTIPNRRRVKVYKPTINIIEPNRLPYTTQASSANIRARIQHVNSAADVHVSVNGRPVNFDYHRGDLNTYCFLDPGKNIAVITASNPHGTARKEVIIFYDRGQIITPPPPPPGGGNRPHIDIYEPNRSPYTTDAYRQVIRANIKHVGNKNDIQFIVNGQNTRNFVFDGRRKDFVATIDLLDGRNEILIRAANPHGKDEEGLVIQRRPDVAPPTVQIKVPASNTTTTDFPDADIRATVRGVAGKSDVTFIVNGSRTNNFSLYGTEFSANIALRPGNNRIVVKAENPGGTDQDEVTIILQQAPPPVYPPQVDITRPANNQTVEAKTVQIIAQTDFVDRKQDINFTLNGQPINHFSFQANAGRIKAELNLKQGNNTIRIRVRNTAGEDMDQINIRYEKPVDPVLQRPKVRITQPDDGLQTDQQRITVKATTQHIDRKDQIDLRINGRPTGNFSFNAARKEITATVNLQAGSNQIRFRVNNPDGQDQDEITVQYRKQRPPSVSITAPDNNTQTDESTIILKAKTQNVQQKRDIELQVNGKTLNNFSFNAGSGQLSARIELQEGNNVLRLRVSNDDGQDMDQVTVRYRAAQPPTVQIQTPGANSTTETSSISFKASVKHITQPSQVTLRLNGKTINKFTLRNNSVAARLQLKEGTNQISISVRNSDGADSDQVQIKYEQPQAKPEVRFTRPSRPGSTVRRSPSPLSASVKNLDSKNQVKLKVNGQTINNFSFDPGSGNLTAEINLVEGQNTIDLSGSNSAGTASSTTTIKYQPDRPTTGSGNKPKISNVVIASPVSNPMNPNIATSGLSAKVDGVRNKSQISVKVNGKATDFTYSATTKKLEATLILSRGNNTIVITANTRNGSDQETRTIEF